MRHVPALGLAVIAALFAIAPSLALAQSDGSPAPAQPGPAQPAPGPAAAPGPPPAAAAPAPPPGAPGAPGTASAPAAGSGPAAASGAGAAEGEPDEEHPTAPTPTAKPPAAARQPLVQKDGMIRIPGGRFTMGSADRAAPSNERPARVVVLPPFWIEKTEVTVAAYRACVDRGACARPPKTNVLCTYDMGDPQLPVSCVPWTLANAFCAAAGRRLPREAEWELAARGTTPIRYPWGGTSGSCSGAATLAHDATQRSCAGKKPWKVGTHPSGASPFGVLDMSGNVEEWVADWYAETVSEASPRAGSAHVLRGGGWLSTPSQSKTTSRNWGSVREAGPNVGFRCARDD